MSVVKADSRVTQFSWEKEKSLGGPVADPVIFAKVQLILLPFKIFSLKQTGTIHRLPHKVTLL